MNTEHFNHTGVGWIILLMLLSCTPQSTDHPLRLIAEWEPQEEIFLGFRTLEMDSLYDGVTLPMIRELSRHIPVNLIVEDSSLLPANKLFLAEFGADTNRVAFIVESPTYFWIRDPAPFFYFDPSGQIGVADFRFNYYTDLHPDSIPEEKIPLDGYDSGFATKRGMPTITSGLVMEGGGFETNGQGTAVLVESVVLKRNRGVDKAAIEQELMSKYNIRTVIWLPFGLAEDPYYMAHLYDDFFGFGTGGHSDEFVRFVNDTTIFLAWEFGDPDPDQPLIEINRLRMETNHEILQSAVDWRGRRFEIIKIPHPVLFYKTVFVDADTRNYLMHEYPDLSLTTGQEVNIVACANYLNFVMTNELVLIPKYWDPSVPSIQRERDSLAFTMFQRYFPGRQIVQINPLILNYAGGGMHCLSFSKPAN